MIAIASALVQAAEDAGIKVPENLEDFDSDAYPHWHVFMAVQLGAPQPFPGCHFDNAKVIAALGKDEAMSITMKGLLAKGFLKGHSK